MAKTKMIYDNTGKIYAVGTMVEIDKMFGNVQKAYPTKQLWIADAESTKRKDCIGAKKSVSFIPIQN